MRIIWLDKQLETRRRDEHVKHLEVGYFRVKGRLTKFWELQYHDKPPMTLKCNRYELERIEEE